MKTILLFLALFQVSVICNAQYDNQGKKDITMCVVLPENADGLNESQMSKLETKVLAIVSQGGIAGVNYAQPIQIYPKFEIENVSASDAGMTTITVAKCSFNLIVKQWPTNTVFSTFEKSVTGSGSNKNEAIVNAIYSINASDPEITSFIAKSKDKILKYYTENCATIISKANNAAKLNNYEEGLALSMSIPAELTDCFKSAQKASLSIYTSYQNYKCKTSLNNAKAMFANHNYADALSELAQVDPKSPCTNEAQALMKEIGAKVDGEQKRTWELLMKAYTDSVTLEKMRINSMERMVLAYYMGKGRRK